MTASRTHSKKRQNIDLRVQSIAALSPRVEEHGDEPTVSWVGPGDKVESGEARRECQSVWAAEARA